MYKYSIGSRYLSYSFLHFRFFIFETDREMLPFKFNVLYNGAVQIFPQNGQKNFPFYFGLFNSDTNYMDVSQAIQKSFLDVIRFQKKVTKNDISTEVQKLHSKLDQHFKNKEFVWIRSQTMRGFHFNLMQVTIKSLKRKSGDHSIDAQILEPMQKQRKLHNLPFRNHNLKESLVPRRSSEIGHMYHNPLLGLKIPSAIPPFPHKNIWPTTILPTSAGRIQQQQVHVWPTTLPTILQPSAATIKQPNHVNLWPVLTPNMVMMQTGRHPVKFE